MKPPLPRDVSDALERAVRLCDHVLREFPEQFKPDSWAFVRHTLLEQTTGAIRALDAALAEEEH